MVPAVLCAEVLMVSACRISCQAHKRRLSETGCRCAALRHY